MNKLTKIGYGDSEIFFTFNKAPIDSLISLTITSKTATQTFLLSASGVREIELSRLGLEDSTNREIRKKSIKLKSKLAKITSVGLIIIFAATTFALLTNTIQARVVLTGSMKPSINPGDVAITTSTKYLKPKIGDVVVYTAKRFNGEKVASFAHRIIGGDAKTGWTLKGDNNPNADVQKPLNTDISGVVIFVIPWLGNLLSPQLLSMILICCFGLWLIWDAFRAEE